MHGSCTPSSPCPISCLLSPVEPSSAGVESVFLCPFLPVFTQKPSCGLIFKAVAVFLFSIITEKWNTLTAVFLSPHYLELYSTRPRNRSAHDFSVKSCQQFTLEAPGQNMKKRQNIDFFMKISYLFLDFRSD